MFFEASREHYYMFAAVAMPFLLRFVESVVKRKFYQCCCDRLWGKDQNPLDELMLPGEATKARVEATGVSMDAILERKVSWDDAREALGWTPCKAKTVALLRLVFWHWMQPALYAWTLISFSDQIDRVQLILGLVVMGREALYPVLTLIALYRNPAFLLVNVGAHRDTDTRAFVQDGLWFTLMPEKYVAAAALGREHACILGILIFGVLLPADCCAIAAMVVGP